MPAKLYGSVRRSCRPARREVARVLRVVVRSRCSHECFARSSLSFEGRPVVGHVASRCFACYRVSGWHTRLVSTPINPVDLRNEDLERYLELSQRRHHVPLVKAFVRPPKIADKTPKEGTPLAGIVRRQDEALLDLYLLVLVRALHEQASPDGIGVGPYPAAVWARLIGLTSSPLTTFSRLLRRGEDHRLLRRKRVTNGIILLPCREEGDGQLYQRSTSARRPYLQIPLEYWRDGWDRLLSLPAKAMLLVLLSRAVWPRWRRDRRNGTS